MNAAASINVARLQLIFSVMIWGTIGLFVRNIPLPSAEIALFRALIALAFLLLWQLIRKRKLPLAAIRKNLLPLCLSGAAMGLNWILLFEAYRYTTVSIATISYYFAPSLVLLASPLLFHEKMRLPQTVLFVLATLGVFLIVGPEFSAFGARQSVGVAFGLGAAVLYASVILLNKSVRDVSGLDRTQVQFGVAALVLLPYVLLTGGFHLAWAGTSGLINLGILGLVHTGLCYCAFFSAVPRLPGQETALLTYLDPLVAIFVSVTVLGETMTAPQIFGGALVLSMALCSELLARKKAVPQ